jgi:hypothetical protein
MHFLFGDDALSLITLNDVKQSKQTRNPDPLTTARLECGIWQRT